MNVQNINGQDYKLPNELNDFQLKMYVHLINWKWKHITTEPGYDRDLAYDAILPDRYADALRVVHPDFVTATREHHHRFPFRLHKYFNHMASSQAANINLFLPILLSAQANAILARLNSSFARLATGQLDRGWRIEYWDDPTGALNDKSALAGTDSDLAIAYYNHADELCLWLIEHKLTEPEFTTCGGYRSKGRKDKVRYDCTRSFADLLAHKNTCYYHDVCRYRYWDITEANRGFFVNPAERGQCPFKGGMNQLWRNQLLAFVVEQQGVFKHAQFSVVRHPGNIALDSSLNAYKDLIGNNPKFSVFTSANVLLAADALHDHALDTWTNWYRNLYNL
jgi:hypothetical protein